MQSSWITKTTNLWLLLIATLLMAMTFPYVAAQWDLTLLDAVSSPAEVRQIIGEMSSQQRSAHAWITATLDVAFPLAYGGLFAGVALSIFKKYGRYLAIPGIVVIPVDLLEGVVQVLALTGAADLVDTKAFLTPLKSTLLLAGIAITFAAWLTWLVSTIKGRFASSPG